jgi:hypothetical protein
MHPLNLTRIAFGCNDVDILRERHRERAGGRESWIDTRYRPTRHVELVGGSLFWIIKHQLVARQEIMGFDEVDGRCRIRLSAALILTRVQPKRAHQGWRYLKDIDAPDDLLDAQSSVGEMPLVMVSELSALGLL